jgi:exopolysaccharide biosynthesis predicted pyruvyltransferase EpsI
MWGRGSIGGGGAFIHAEASLVRVVREWHRYARCLVVLPHTYLGQEDLLAEFGSNVELFARERVSHGQLQSHARGAKVHLAHDMAFELDLEKAMGCRTPIARESFAPKRLFRRYRWMLLEKGRRRLFGHRVLHCFRTDNEHTSIPLACRATRMIIRSFSHYDEIQTNRLHLAVAGALLGKRVRFHANSYHKCRSVYDFSIKERFPNVQ